MTTKLLAILLVATAALFATSMAASPGLYATPVKNNDCAATCSALAPTGTFRSVNGGLANQALCQGRPGNSQTLGTKTLNSGCKYWDGILGRTMETMTGYNCICLNTAADWATAFQRRPPAIASWAVTSICRHPTSMVMGYWSSPSGVPVRKLLSINANCYTPNGLYNNQIKWGVLVYQP